MIWMTGGILLFMANRQKLIRMGLIRGRKFGSFRI